MRSSALSLGLLVSLCVAGCQREERALRTDPPVAEALAKVALAPEGISGAPPDVEVAQGPMYDSNAWQLSQGKRLYDWFNCKGCHADGGGVAGPGFMSGWWRYGPQIESVYASIRDGRPHGMPPFRNRMTDDQIWQLAGYVRSIGMFEPQTGAPARNDEMQSRPAESRGPATSDVPSPSR